MKKQQRFTRSAIALACASFLFPMSAAWADSAKLTFNGHSYQRFDTAMKWTDAKVFCENKGAHLATITSQAENDFVVANFVSSSVPIILLGASDVAKEGTWQWITGEAWSYTNWHSGEPNNGGGVVANENYLAFHSLNGLVKWNDIQATSNPPLCEWDGIIASTTISISASSFVNGQNVAMCSGTCAYGTDSLLNAPPYIGTTNSAEWDFNVPTSGKYELFAEYAAAQSRPVTISFNGITTFTSALAAITGGWMPTNRQVLSQGFVQLAAGKTTMRVASSSVFSHIKGFKLVPIDAATTSAPTCTLTPTPSTITAGQPATLTATCTPNATSYQWSDTACASTSATCTVTPNITTNYSVKGGNSGGMGVAAGGIVTVYKTPELTIDSPEGFIAGKTITLKSNLLQLGIEYKMCIGTGSKNYNLGCHSVPIPFSFPMESNYDFYVAIKAIKNGVDVGFSNEVLVKGVTSITSSAQYDPSKKIITIPFLKINDGIYSNVKMSVFNPVVDVNGIFTGGDFILNLGNLNNIPESSVPKGQPIVYWDNPTRALVFPTMENGSSMTMQRIGLASFDSSTAVFNNPVGIINNTNPSAQWIDFVSKIKTGDILLYSKQLGCTGDACGFVGSEAHGAVAWGYHNHAALVISTSNDGKMIQVFEGRNPVEGVGAMWINEDNIRRTYEVVELYRVNGNYSGEEVVKSAIKKYSNFYYDPSPWILFGGGITAIVSQFESLGLVYHSDSTEYNSTYCSDLVARVYKDIGVDLRDAHVFLDGGQVLWGRLPANLFTPDELANSKNISWIANLPPKR